MVFQYCASSSLDYWVSIPCCSSSLQPQPSRAHRSSGCCCSHLASAFCELPLCPLPQLRTLYAALHPPRGDGRPADVVENPTAASLVRARLDLGNSTKQQRRERDQVQFGDENLTGLQAKGREDAPGAKHQADLSHKMNTRRSRTRHHAHTMHASSQSVRQARRACTRR